MTRGFSRCLGCSCSGASNGRAKNLNLNVTTNLMGVTNLQLYDVLNVMEKVGSVDRLKKNLVAWRVEDTHTAVKKFLLNTMD